MLKMMKLDWLATKYYHKKLPVILICLLVIGWLSSIYLVPMGAFLLFSFATNTFAVEEKGDLNRFYLILPVKRSMVVRGRYVLSFVLYAGGVLLGAALMPLTNLYSLSKWYPSLEWMLALFAFSFLFYGSMSLAMYPVLFRMGYQKGKMWGYYVPAIVICLIYVAVMEYDALARGGTLIFDLFVYASEHMPAVSGGMLVLGAVLLGISYMLSVRIYERREF